MNEEILEITKKFHDTYEKLASEYTYETREDTKVFDINSNNGKLMYATVNEIVSPILKGNKILEENYDRIYNENCKLREEHNITDISLLDENQELKLELSGYRQSILEDKDMLGLKEKNQKYKEVIDKANKKLNNFIECCKAEKLESGSDYLHHQYWDMFERFNKQIKDILKEVSK